MTEPGEARSMRGGRHLVVVVNDENKIQYSARAQHDPDDETRLVVLDNLLETLVHRFGGRAFSLEQLAAVLEETIDDEGVTVSPRGAKYAAEKLVDEGQLDGRQLGNLSPTPEWKYRLATRVRNEYAAEHL